MSRSASGESNDGKEDREEAAADKLGGKVTLGDLIWVKVGKDTWWPAQVVDENTVTESNKPKNRPAGKVLVRLYGSYQHLYVDPIKCHSQFKIVLEQNNGSHRDIFDKALDQEKIRSVKSSKSKSPGSKSKGNSSKKEKVSKKAKLDKEREKAKRKNQTKDASESPKMRTPKKNKILNNDEVGNMQSDV
ncbi:putative oxidoreductase GLYR1 isoform X2 [Carica papaya]|uniref:putative oxidoreductase GLYR1 isoform X2 n=1 Tax=Carica papaya TaxID=3649 RepID=UPI000B8CDAFC|nr:putative oxidoreductase GLYR1 isoform X2 [Carica papaya]XP_021903546.1 putative oxidoreductase GLYR1 isoform X2 [Carica papaya]